MKTIWIDRGKDLVVDAGRNASNLNYPFQPDNLDLPLRHYGMVRLWLGKRRAQLTWDVDEADPLSVDRALEVLAESSHLSRLEIRYYKDGWWREFYRAADDAAQRMSQIARFSGVKLLSQTVVKDLPDQEIKFGDPVLASAYRAWQTSDALESLRSSSAEDHCIVLSRAGASDQLKFEKIGPRCGSRTCFGHAAVNGAIGQPSNFPLGGGKFDDRVAGDYDSAMRHGEPIYQHILGRIMNSELNGPAWWPYQRLLLPIKRPDGSEALYSMTKITQQIEIPVLAQ